MTNIEIKIFDTGLDFAPIQNKINEPELRKYFKEFCRRMGYFRYDISHNFNEKPARTAMSKWKPTNGQPGLEVFLNRIEKDIFELTESPLHYSNVSKEEW